VSTAAGIARSSAVPAAPTSLKTWAGLLTIYVVWGSTYLAIRVMVETIPPLLGAGLRFLIAGALMVVVLAAVRGWRAVRPTRAQLAGAALVGLLLPGANAVVSVAEVDVPSNLAALLIASVPLILIVLRSVAGDRPARASYLGVIVGFAGVGLLLLPGERPDGATLAGMLLCVGAAVMWASGSFAGSRIDLPDNPLVSVGWQMLLGGIAITLAGLVAGEAGDVGPMSLDSILGFVYLVLIGSLIAYTAYAWLLRNVPVSKVATYAYVNPAVAIALGWLILDEAIPATTLVGAAVIIASVALTVRAESGRAATRRRAVRTASTAPPASASG
jgi:drug/metabolite transporter (DMT)-like permease